MLLNYLYYCKSKIRYTFKIRMIRKLHIIFSVFLLLILTANLATGQGLQKPAAKTFVKFKPPVVKTYLGKISGNDATTGVVEIKNLIVLPIKIIDDKDVTYTINSYQFVYKRQGETEDEESGKTSPATDIVSNHFSTTPLPEIWQKNIIEGAHKGEEIYFFDIIAIDKQGRRFFAPELKIKIQ